MTTKRKSIWFPDGLAGKVPDKFHELIEQVIYQTWKFENDNTQWQNGAWCCAIDTGRHLREINSAKALLNLGYQVWERIGPPGQPVPSPIADGQVMCLFVWHPATTLLCQIYYPREWNLLYPSLEAQQRAEAWGNKERFLEFSPRDMPNIPLVPTRRCVNCDKPSKHRCVCRLVYYCDTQCQKDHRSKHAEVCNQVLQMDSHNYSS